MSAMKSDVCTDAAVGTTRVGGRLRPGKDVKRTLMI